MATRRSAHPGVTIRALEGSRYRIRWRERQADGSHVAQSWTCRLVGMPALRPAPATGDRAHQRGRSRAGLCVTRWGLSKRSTTGLEDT